MGVQLGKMTLRSLFGANETVKYPFETKPVPEGLKGHISNDIDSCIFCGMCERTCPSHAITVDRAAKTWSINRFRCVQCKSCTRACVKNCLTMEPEYQKPSQEIYVETLTQEEKPAEA